MLLLAPRTVSFGEVVWQNVTLVAIDRETSRAALDFGDLGPHPVFADAPEQTTRLRVIQELGADDLGAPRPGEIGTVTLFTSPTATSRPRMKLSVLACVESVTHEVSLKRGTHRTITLLALSPDGASDPITTESSD